MSNDNPTPQSAEIQRYSTPCRHCGKPVDSHECVGSLIDKLQASERACAVELAAAERCAGERDKALAERDQWETAALAAEGQLQDVDEVLDDESDDTAAVAVARLMRERNELRAAIAKLSEELAQHRANKHTSISDAIDGELREMHRADAAESQLSAALADCATMADGHRKVCQELEAALAEVERVKGMLVRVHRLTMQEGDLTWYIRVYIANVLKTMPTAPAAQGDR